MGRPAAGGARRQVRRLGLRRPRARLLGRPLRSRRGAGRRRLLPLQARAARAPRPRLLGDRRAPGRAGRVRPGRLAPSGRPSGRRVGRRRSRGSAPARRRQDEGHGARGGQAGRACGDRLHGLVDLAHALLVPAERLGRRPARLRGLRRALEPDHRRVRRGGREVRPRGAPHRDRLRLPDHPQGARGDRPARGVRDQLRSLALLPPVPRLGRLRRGVRRPRLPRARQGLEAAARWAPLDTRLAHRLRRARSRLDLRLSRARRRGLRGSVPGPQPDRLHRPALDRMGGLRDGPRLGRPGRSGVRAAHRLRALDRWPSTPRSRRRTREWPRTRRSAS